MMRLLFILLIFSVGLINAGSDLKDIDWKLLGQFNFETQKVSQGLSIIKNNDITIAGFIVPLEDDGDIDYVKEFLLVPDPMSCIHEPPPPPNQMIYVTMNEAIPLDMDLRGVYISGKLSLASTDMRKTYVGYEMTGKFAKEANIEMYDPWAEILEADGYLVDENGNYVDNYEGYAEGYDGLEDQRAQTHSDIIIRRL